MGLKLILISERGPFRFYLSSHAIAYQWGNLKENLCIFHKAYITMIYMYIVTPPPPPKKKKKTTYKQKNKQIAYKCSNVWRHLYPKSASIFYFNNMYNITKHNRCLGTILKYCTWHDMISCSLQNYKLFMNWNVLADVVLWDLIWG